MKNFTNIFKKVNGKQIIFQYMHAHVLLFSFLITLLLGFRKKSLEIVRLAVNNRILNKLRRKNKKFICNFKLNYKNDLPRKNSEKIWLCWLQGLDNAPDLVKACYNSLKKNITNKDIVIITNENYKNYIDFPEYINNKIKLGKISFTHFSDLIRLELLSKYGGTWIDATVFCTGTDIPDYMFNSNLFLFQDLKPGLDGHPARISSWYITSCSNNPIIVLTRELLYNYWKTNSTLIDYYLVHDFFELAIEAYPEEWDKVIPFSNSVPHILLFKLFKKYDEKEWQYIKKMCPFQKLSYKFDDKKFLLSDTYYSKILKK